MDRIERYKVDRLRQNSRILEPSERIDLMFTPSFRRHAILELNAFGDLLPSARHREQDTYTAELTAATAGR